MATQPREGGSHHRSHTNSRSEIRTWVLSFLAALHSCLAPPSGRKRRCVSFSRAHTSPPLEDTQQRTHQAPFQCDQKKAPSIVPHPRDALLGKGGFRCQGLQPGENTNPAEICHSGSHRSGNITYQRWEGKGSWHFDASASL